MTTNTNDDRCFFQLNIAKTEQTHRPSIWLRNEKTRKKEIVIERNVSTFLCWVCLAPFTIIAIGGGGGKSANISGSIATAAAVVATITHCNKQKQRNPINLNFHALSFRILSNVMLCSCWMLLLLLPIFCLFPNFR